MKTFDRYVLAVATVSAPLVDRFGVASFDYRKQLVEEAQRLASAVCEAIGHEGPYAVVDEHGRASCDFRCERCGWMVLRETQLERRPPLDPAAIPAGEGSPYR